MPSVNCSIPLSINVCDIPLTNFQCGRQYENEHQELDWQDLLMICSWKLHWLHCTCTEHERLYWNLLSLDELKHLISAYKSAVTRIINSYFDEYTILLVLSSRAACQHVVLDPMHRNLEAWQDVFFSGCVLTQTRVNTTSVTSCFIGLFHSCVQWVHPAVTVYHCLVYSRSLVTACSIYVEKHCRPKDMFAHDPVCVCVCVPL